MKPEHMPCISLAFFFLSSFVIVKSQDEVMCYNATSCGGHFEMSLMDDCCDIYFPPVGLSYNNTTTMECNNCPFSKREGSCSSQGAIRLQGGTLTRGRVEVCNDNIWGTVCGDEWDVANSQVACRQLGYSAIGATKLTGYAVPGGIGQIWLDQVKCVGNEITLFSCNANPIGVHDCSHFDDIGVSCQAGGTLCAPHGAIRLQGGTATSGRVEVCNNNIWGTVCDDAWQAANAQVACRQLGYSAIGATILTGSEVPDGTGRIWLDNVNCVGDEISLFNCNANPIGNHNCLHLKDVGVSCQAGGTPCSSQGAIRLQGGTDTSGRVEVCNNDVWGSVCDDSWENANAEVACRQLGYSAVGATTIYASGVPDGSGQIWLDNVNCVGNETSLFNCSANPIGNHNCFHSEDVRVSCQAVIVKSQDEVMCYNATSCRGLFEMSLMEDCCDNNVSSSEQSYSNSTTMKCHGCPRVIVKSQDEGMCYNATSCVGDYEMSTMEDCCDNHVAPSGLSYSNSTAMKCNDCPRAFGFFKTTYSGKEHREAHSILVGTISGPTLSSFNVTVTLNRITAGEGDMVLLTTNLTFSVGRDPLPVSFILINDSISQEANETFTLTLTLADAIEGYELHLVLNGTILDDDIAVFKLSEKEFREDEKPNAIMAVKIIKEQNVWLANPVTFRISPLTIDDAMSRSLNVPVEGHAQEINFDSPVQANADDFNTTTFTVDFPADEGSNILTHVDAFIAVVDDDINENGQQLFIVHLEAVNATDISLVDNTQHNLAICKIFDNDPLVIGFGYFPMTSFAEPVEIRLVQVPLVKNRESEQTFRVAITVLTFPSGASIPADFKASNLSILFPPTSESIQYTFSLQPDQTIEGVESFNLMCLPSEGSITYRISDFTKFIIILIEDDDLPKVVFGFERTLYSVDESAVSVEVCVIISESTLPDGQRLNLVLSGMTVSGSADMDDFYDGFNFELDIDENLLEPSGRQCYYIPIIDDDALEKVESFTCRIYLSYLLSLGEMSIIEFSTDVTQIDILDDDDAVIGFISAPYTVNEFDRMAIMTVGVLNGSSIQTDVTVSVYLFDGSAIASSDYLNDLSNGGIIILNASNPSVNVSFSLVDDSVVEPREKLSASLYFPGDAQPRVILDPAPAEVIILGDDDPVVGFVKAPYIVNEFDRKVTLMVAFRTDDTSVQVFLSISLMSGTANISSDYLSDLSGDGNITLHAGIPIGSVSFSLVDDLVNESREHLSASLELLKTTDSHVTLALASADIIILGDEVPTIGFRKREYFVDECACNVSMEVGFLSDGEVFAISLHIFLLPGTANVSYDYVDDLSDGGWIVLNASNPTVNISFSLIDDSVVESLETLSAKLKLSDDDDHPHVNLDPASLLINIQDNDEVAFGFEETHYLVNESAGILEVCSSVTNLKGGIQISISVTAEITLQARTGSADVKDFKEPPLTKFNLTISDLDTGNIDNVRMCFNITIINDEIREDIESFTLELSAPLHLQITCRPNITVVSILDEDDATIGFFDASYSFGEPDSKASLQFGVISGSLQIDVSVQLDLSQESTLFLMEGDGGVLNADQPTITVSFTLVNDNIYELTKLVVANLSFVGDQPARVTIAPESAQIFIIDDEVLDFRFDPDRYFVSEDDVNVTLNVRLFSGNLGDIGVILRASIANSSNFHEFTFEGSDPFKSDIELPIMSNDMAERPMDFKVELSFINYTNGQAYKIEDKERILLGDAEVTIRPPLPISYIIGAILGPLTLSLLGGIIYSLVAVVRRMTKPSANQNLEHDNMRSSFRKDPDNTEELKSYKVQSSFKLNISKHLMINSCNLKMNETVGQGQYGIVYRGSLSKGFTKGFTEVVAVKTLKGFLDKSLVRGLLEECSRMSTLDHPNVLTLIGVCVDGGPVPYIVMPFMFNGSLISYLIKMKNEFYFSIDCEMDEEIMQASSRLMNFCLQIAKGMEYLTSKMIIHRDLAARNCMVDLHFVVKVSDFGLSESINPSKDYFRQQEEGVKLPFKWMAPESLEDGLFSEKTDVWSYGVTCWEVFSAGKNPYAGVIATDLCPMLENGYRMDKPNNSACSDIMYSEVIQKCWELKPENRPSFRDLVAVASSLLEANAGYMDFGECTIPEKTIATANAETIEMTAVDRRDIDTVQVMETSTDNEDARYVTLNCSQY